MASPMPVFMPWPPAPVVVGQPGDEIGVIKRDLDIALGRRTVRLHVGHIEELAVGAAGKARAHLLAHAGARAVTAGHIGRRATLFAAIGRAQMHLDLLALVFETQAFGLALHFDVQCCEPRRRSCRPCG